MINWLRFLTYIMIKKWMFPIILLVIISSGILVMDNFDRNLGILILLLTVPIATSFYRHSCFVAQVATNLLVKEIGGYDGKQK